MESFYNFGTDLRSAFKGVWLYRNIFPTISMTFCLPSKCQNPFQKKPTLKRMNLIPIENGDKNEYGRVVSPESVSIHLYCTVIPLFQPRGFYLSSQSCHQVIMIVSWMVGCFGYNGPLRQYFSLYRVVSQRE